MVEEGPAADGRLALCLSDIDGFESVIARMPTPEECQHEGVSADAPVLVMQRRGGHDQLYRADQVRLTIDPGPPPAAWDAHDAARYVLGCILENLQNVLFDVTRLDTAMSGPARSLVKLADEHRQWRAAEVSPSPREQRDSGLTAYPPAYLAGYTIRYQNGPLTCGNMTGVTA